MEILNLSTIEGKHTGAGDMNSDKRDTLSELEEARLLIDLERQRHVRLLKKLAIAQDEAELSRHAKSEFLATMNHEIRTPITSIMGLLDMMMNDESAPENLEKISKIKDATTILTQIIDDITDMSMLESGEKKLETVDFHLPSLIDDVVNTVRETGKDTAKENLEFDILYSEDLPKDVNANATRIRQILLNLIGNAYQFTDTGKITIEGTSLRSPDGGEFLQLSVHDTGIGIKLETVKNLFSLFTPVDDTLSLRYEAPGVGLSICKRLVDLMGGEIGARSEIGKGSTFWFTLPFHSATVKNTGLPWKNPDHPTRFGTARPLNILLAEDNLLNQQILTAVMKGFGHCVVAVEDGSEAVKSHKWGHFDPILMDIRMPEMSGVEATRLIRKMYGPKSDVPIVALSADNLDVHVRSYYEAGVNGFVDKPISIPHLMTAINEAIGEDIHFSIEESL